MTPDATRSRTGPAESRPGERPAGAFRCWVRGLPERHGGLAVLIALTLVVTLGLGLRVAAALVPEADPRRDSVNYQRIATALYEKGTFGDAGVENVSDYSPGAPMLFAAVYRLTGAPYAERALLAVALLGAAMVLLVYLLARRLAGGGRTGAAAGLLAALGAAVYPAYIEYSGRLMSEPVAAFGVAAAFLAMLWALDRRRPAAWLLPGVLLGATTMTRPEYLLAAALVAPLVLVALVSRRERREAVAGVALLVAGFAAVLAPWTIRNYVVLDRVVPVSTGAGKALFVGSYLPGDGSEPEVRRVLIRRYEGRYDEFGEVLDRLAARHPDLDRDQALGRLGRENLDRYALGQPVDYAGMLLRKLGRIWWRGPAGTADYSAWVAIHRGIVLLALAGLVLLALRRRIEAALLAVPIAAVTAAGMVLLASTRRSAPLMPLVLALAGTASAWLALAVAGRLRGRGRPGVRPPWRPQAGPGDR